MKHNIIKTENYLLVVDESEIKEGDWYYYENGKTLKGVEQVVNGKIAKTMASKKIISHLPLNGSPILQGVDLLPPLGDDDAVKWARSQYSSEEGDYEEIYYLGLIKGYNQAKEKYKYTEEDLRKAMFLYNAWITGGTPSLRIAETAEERQKQIIQSLSQPKAPTGFECVTIPMNIDEIREQGKGFLNANTNKIKTTTTPEGYTQWVGTYIYE